MKSGFCEKLQPLSAAPKIWAARAEYTDGDVKGLFYESVPYQGKPTRVFAWLGFPEKASAKSPVPGIVLVHGGGGTAMSDWVRFWNAKGYAAIAMDTCGCVPGWRENPYCAAWPRHDHSGPLHDRQILKSEEMAPEDQWPYHGTAAILGAFAVLASQPRVKADCIGLTGISWGGFLSCIAGRIESRFRFVIPVYGCGGFNSEAASLCANMPSRLRNRWFSLWDPDLYLPKAKAPFLWITDAEDPAYPVNFWAASASLTKNPNCRQSLRIIDFCHDHLRCSQSNTIPDYARAMLANETLPSLNGTKLQGHQFVCMLLDGGRKIVSMELAYTRVSGVWADAVWRTVPAVRDGSKLSADVPMFARAAFFRVRDDAGSVWTSPPLFL